MENTLLQQIKELTVSENVMEELRQQLRTEMRQGCMRTVSSNIAQYQRDACLKEAIEKNIDPHTLDNIPDDLRVAAFKIKYGDNYLGPYSQWAAQHPDREHTDDLARLINPNYQREERLPQPTEQDTNDVLNLLAQMTIDENNARRKYPNMSDQEVRNATAREAYLRECRERVRNADREQLK